MLCTSTSFAQETCTLQRTAASSKTQHHNTPLCTSTLRATTIEMLNRSLYRSATSLSCLLLVEPVKYILYLDMYPNLAIEVLRFPTNTYVFRIFVGNLTLGAVRSRGFVCFEIISIVICACIRYIWKKRLSQDVPTTCSSWSSSSPSSSLSCSAACPLCVQNDLKCGIRIRTLL